MFFFECCLTQEARSVLRAYERLTSNFLGSLVISQLDNLETVVHQMGLTLINIKQLFADVTIQVLRLLVTVRQGKFIYKAAFRQKAIQSAL